MPILIPIYIGTYEDERMGSGKKLTLFIQAMTEEVSSRHTIRIPHWLLTTCSGRSQGRPTAGSGFIVTEQVHQRNRAKALLAH